MICEYCRGTGCDYERSEDCIDCDGTGVAKCLDCGGDADTDYEGDYMCGPCLDDLIEQELQPNVSSTTGD